MGFTEKTTKQITCDHPGCTVSVEWEVDTTDMDGQDIEIAWAQWYTQIIKAGWTIDSDDDHYLCPEHAKVSAQ